MSIGHHSQSTWYSRLFNESDYFAIHYYERVRRAFLSRCKNPELADDLTQQFFERKVLEGKLLEKFKEKLETVRGDIDGNDPASAPPSFRKFLYQAIGNFYIDHYRKAKRKDRPNLDLQEFDNLVADEARNLDPDALYALSVLHRAIQSVRNHFRKKNKPHQWDIFESLVLEEFLTGREPSSLETLRAKYYPGSKDNQEIHNALTTVKRVFRRVLWTYFESESDDSTTCEESFAEWMAILKRSNASLHSALQAAYRSADLPSADASMALSVSMARGRELSNSNESDMCDDDEMSILLSFRLDLPLHEWINSDRMMELLPRKQARGGNDLLSEIRQLTMASLLESANANSGIPGELSAIELLSLIKNESKRLSKSNDTAIPRHIHSLFYTLSALIALERFGKKISSLDEETLSSNIQWYLKRPWLDDRARKAFREFHLRNAGGN